MELGWLGALELFECLCCTRVPPLACPCCYLGPPVAVDSTCANGSPAALSPHLPPQVWNTAFQVVAARQRAGAEAADFSFRAFMDGPVASVRRKPARARCAWACLSLCCCMRCSSTLVNAATQVQGGHCGS